MRIGVLSDTHAPRFWKFCPEPVARLLKDVDVILHAGDICTVDVLEELRCFAPVYAVKGNNDDLSVVEWGAAPHKLELTFAGVNIGMIHDAGNKENRLNRLRKQFPGADIVIFGHSHFPLEESEANFRIFNPGSPTDKRRQPHKTMGILDLDGGTIRSSRIVVVD